MKKKNLKRKIVELETELVDLKKQLLIKSFSKKAQEIYDDLLYSCPEIKIWFNDALHGTVPEHLSKMYPPPNLRQPAHCLEYIAEIYMIEPTDIRLILDFKE